jgi:RNA polymerase sigma factor (sigma-70 family)
MDVHLPPFQSLVDAHWRDVAGLAHALTGPDDGDDVAQQAWTQAYAAYPSLRSTTNLRGWLLTITHRCAMDAHRGRGRRAVPTEDETIARTGDRAVAGPEAGLVDDDLWGRVARLPARQREAVVLKYVGDLDHPAIAEVLGTTSTMSRRLVSDGLKALREASR